MSPPPPPPPLFVSGSTYIHSTPTTPTHHHDTHSIATNAVIPIAFSFLGDLYPPDNRSLPSTLVTAAMGVGACLCLFFSICAHAQGL